MQPAVGADEEGWLGIAGAVCAGTRRVAAEPRRVTGCKVVGRPLAADINLDRKPCWVHSAGWTSWTGWSGSGGC